MNARKLKQREQECRKRILRLVEKMIEDQVTTEWLVEACQKITQNDYDDVVAERAVSMLCGYPLCPMHLTQIPKKKYHICTKTNKVFDITERKQFCSDWCYRASLYLKKQLHVQALWLREEEDPLNIDFLQWSDISGDRGKEVDLGFHRITAKEVHSERVSKPKSQELDNSQIKVPAPYISRSQLEELSNQMEHLKIVEKGFGQVVESKEDLSQEKHISEEGTTESYVHSKGPASLDSSGMKADHRQSSFTTAFTLETKNETCLAKSDNSNLKTEKTITGICQLNSPDPEDAYMEEIAKALSKKLPPPIKKSKFIAKIASTPVSEGTSSAFCSRHLSVSEKMQSVLSEWVTSRTLEYLLGQEQFSALLKEENLACSPACSCDTQKMLFQYAQICKRIDREEKEDEYYDRIILEKEQAEAKANPGKCKEQNKSSNDVKKKRNQKIGRTGMRSPKSSEEANLNENDSEVPEPVLPTIYSHSQMASRRKIVSNKLQLIYQEVLMPTGIPVSCVLDNLKDLLSTFVFSASNVTFEAAEWTFLAVCILKMLTRKEQKIAASLDTEEVKGFLDVVLQGMKTSMKKVDKIIQKVLDPHAVCSNDHVMDG